MSYQPPTTSGTPDVPPSPDARETGIPVPTAPEPVASTLPAPVGQPYAAMSPATASGTASGPGAGVDVRPWRSSNDVIAIIAQVLLGLTALVNLAVAFTDVRLAGLVRERDFDRVVELATSAESTYRLAVLLAVPTVIVFVVWVHRLWTSDRSAHAVYTRSTRLAVGGWFIPVANLLLGGRALRDLWHGTAAARAGVDQGPGVRSTPRLLLGWWVAWCAMFVTTLASRGSQAGVDRATSLTELVSALESAINAEVAACTISAVAAVLLVLVIRRITGFTRR